MARAPVLQEIEAQPEADRLEPFAHPRVTARPMGHGKAEAAFAQAFGAGRVHHGWLITGREGIGKATLAYAMARFALAKPEERGHGDAGPLSVPPDSVAARQVRALSHPGLLVLRRPWDHKSKRHLSVIPVDEVRRLRSFLAHSAGPQAWRVVIVDQADELNIAAANALLKSLEEPPPRALFLLVSSEPGRLLTTIRSRCRRLDLGALAPADLKTAAIAALAAAGLDPPAEKDWPRLTGLAQGSVRRLLALAQSDGAKLAERVHGLLGTLPKVDWPLVHLFADDVTAPGAEHRFEQAFAMLMEAVARLVRARALGGGAGEEDRLAARIIPAHSTATWAELWESLLVRKAELDALNLDRKSLILETFARFEAAAKG